MEDAFGAVATTKGVLCRCGGLAPKIGTPAPAPKPLIHRPLLRIWRESWKLFAGSRLIRRNSSLKYAR